MLRVYFFYREVKFKFYAQYSIKNRYTKSYLIFKLFHTVCDIKFFNTTKILVIFYFQTSICTRKLQ